MNGYTLVYLEEFKAKEDELFDSSVKAFDLAFTYNAKLVYDGNGVGAGVGSNIKELIRQGYRKGTKIRYEAFDAGSKPANPKDMYLSEHGYTQMTNDEYFENRKAQAWWMLADKIRYTYSLVREYTKTGTIAGTINTEMLFTIDSKKLSPKILEKMIDELSTPRKEESGRLKNMVEKKKSLLDRGIKSPNLADAVVMANFRYNMDSKSTFGGKMRYT
jgi:phage terminase large subunit